MKKWLKNAIFYEIYPQSFKDSNADGIGDFNGIIEKLDYIKDMGFTAIWMNPCFKSPFADAGYDVEDFYNIYQEPAITKYMEGLFPEKSAERQYIREYIEKVYGYYEFGVWTVLEKESGAVIGRAGFSYREGYEEPELGYIIGVPWQRKGYAEEVCRGILDFGWKELGFGAVQVLVETENEPSLHLCRKLGFTGEEIVQIGGREHYRLVKTG